MTHRLAVLVSGEGTLLQAMIAYGLPIALVVGDRECPALNRVQGFVPTEIVSRDFSKKSHDVTYREHFSRALLEKLRDHEIEVVACAGFMTIMSMRVLSRYVGKMLNIHPSLLPKYPGAQAVAAAVHAGERESGCTIHLVSDIVDGGKILKRKAIAIDPRDGVSATHERIKQVERTLYPPFIEQFIGSVPYTT